jgi:hypothetical protein
VLLLIATSVGVPVGIFAGCLIVGVLAATRYLPELPPGRVPGLCFFLVCGMIGAGLALAGLDIYNAVETGERLLGALGVSGALVEMLFQCGLVFGVAAIVYLLAARTAGSADEAAPHEGPADPSA